MKKQRKSSERAALHNLDGRQGAGILVISTAIQRLLLAKRGPNGAQPGTWAPFGGMVEESDPTTVEGGLRELFEEARIDLDFSNAKVIETALYTDNAHPTFQFITYAAVVDYVPEVIVNEESLGFGWFTLTDLPRDLHPGAAKMFKDPVVAQAISMLYINSKGKTV